MNADKELIKYIDGRYKSTQRKVQENEPHGDDRFKHIYYSGEKSAFKEILMLLEEINK